MRIPTLNEIIFLSITGITVITTTYLITPKIVSDIRQDIILASKKPKSKSHNSFYNGFILGGSIGVIGTLKVISNKVNNP